MWVAALLVALACGQSSSPETKNLVLDFACRIAILAPVFCAYLSCAIPQPRSTG